MSETQEILAALSEALHDNQISEDMCHGALAVLDGIPEVFHADALKSLLGIEKPFTEEEAAPENYAVVKTFDSDTFHIGDEVITGTEKYVIWGKDGDSFYRVFGNGIICAFDKHFADFRRTGRNFPAIPAILEALRK